MNDIMLEITILTEKVHNEYKVADEAEIGNDGYRHPTQKAKLLKEAWQHLGQAEKALRESQYIK